MQGIAHNQGLTKFRFRLGHRRQLFRSLSLSLVLSYADSRDNAPRIQFVVADTNRELAALVAEQEPRGQAVLDADNRPAEEALPAPVQSDRLQAPCFLCKPNACL